MPKTLITLVGFVWAFGCSAATAQTVCGDRAAFAARLLSEYAERPVSLGLASNGSVIEVFASEKGTFSVLVTKPDGSTCLVAAGDNWSNAPAEKGKEV